jgi:ubiquitin C-terminal hydrolase
MWFMVVILIDSPLTLSAFLEYFVREELFDGPIYQCDSCSKGKSAEIQYRNASKCTRITLLPALLRVHLKRFRWQGIKREKIASHVDFPLQLDMERFCEANTARDTYDAAGVKQTSSDPDAYLYDLLGVIVHHGKGINSGHYTAYCHNPVTSAWTHCNDAKVTPCSLREVLEEDVYILVYSYRPASKFVSLLQSNGDFTSKRRKSVHE